MISLIDKGISIVEEANKKGITLRLLGATAIKIHCPKYTRYYERLGRPLTDFDFIGLEKEVYKIQKLFEEMGYEMAYLTSLQINAKRRVFMDKETNWKFDVFLDKLIMNHTIDLRKRMRMDYPTIPLADLFLEKMQIMQLADKDVKDTIILLREHDIGDTDKETLNCKYIAEILSDDHDFYVTVITNLEKVKEMLSEYAVLQEEDKADVRNKINEIVRIINAKPKSFKWRLKAKLGIKGQKIVEEFEIPRRNLS
jgi:hypothetical protein